MTHQEIVDTLLSLKPGAKWALTGTSYSGLLWSEDNVLSKPTAEELGL